MEYTIRRATKDDADAWAEILHTSAIQTYSQIISSDYLAKHYNISALKEQFLAELAAGENGDKSREHYIISCNGEPAGILKLGQPVARYSDGNNYYREDINGIGEIKSLHVVDKFKISGIGSQAIQFAENRLRELGYSVSHMWVKQKNSNAIEFYKHLGYEVTPYLNPNTNDKAPSVVLEKSLVQEKVTHTENTEIDDERY